MKKLIFILLSVNSLLAQTTTVNPYNISKNMKKYWFYRTKLVNDFMLVGTGQGMSLPFNRRASSAPVGLDSPTLEVGDEISTLGYYIGVLATEYRLLVDNAQDVTKVKHELFCALNAVNRLDYKAESTMYGSCGPSLNGFLMRDDIPFYFARDNYTHFNYFHPDGGGIASDNHFFPNNNGNNDRGFASIAPQGQWSVESNLQDFENPDLAHANQGDLHAARVLYMSQDHVINLLFGLSLVQALVDPTATDGSNNFTAYEPQSLNPNNKLLQESENIAGRLVHYVGKTSSWHIKDPCTGIGLTIYQGGYAEPFSYPLAEIGCIATGQGTSILTACTGCPVPTACNTYHDWYTESIGFLSWQALSLPAATKNDNASMIAQLSAACNCIYATVASHIVNQITQVLTSIWDWLGWVWGWVTSIVTTIISYVVPILNTNDTNDGMEANVEYWDYQYAPFARRLIHGGNAALVPPQNVLFHGKPGAQYMNDLLDAATCDGPWNVKGAYSTYDWSSVSMIDHPEQRADGHFQGKDYPINTGEYNGIDYMLYHNIWRLYHNRYISNDFNMIDLSDRIIKDNFPLSNNQGDLNHPLEIDAFETMVIDSKIGDSSPANVDFRAGKTISHGPNFHVNSINGTIFHEAQAQPFSCQQNYVNNNFYSRGQDTSVANTNTPKGYNYASTDMGIVKTHHVEYSPEVVNYLPKTPVEVDNTAAVKNQHNQTTSNYQQAIVNAVVKSALDENDLLILPNPSNGVFKIKLPAVYKSNTMNIWVYNMSGNLIANKENLKKWPETEDIDVSEYGAGTYMLRILTENGKSYYRKVIVK